MPNKTARIFNNGGSQAVRLPAEFRFEGDEVFVRRDERSGDVILSKKAGWGTWTEYLQLRDVSRLEIPDEFMADRPLNTSLNPKDLFGNEH
jgi:antitoxin VapB